jgi:hypothetical protein
MKGGKPPNGKLEALVGSAVIGVFEGTFIGLGFIEEGAAIAIPAVIGGVLGFVLPLVILPSELSVGKAGLMTGGRIWGGVQGFAIANLILSGEWRGDNAGVASLVIVGGSVVGGSVMALIASKVSISGGDAAVINSGALWGTVGAGLLWLAFGSQDALIGPFVLAGVNVGLLAGGVLATQVELSRAHVALIDLAGFAGLVAGAALAGVLNFGDQEKAARFEAGGMVIGLVAGAFLTRSFDDVLRLPVQAVAGFAIDSVGKQVSTFGLSMKF